MTDAFAAVLSVFRNGDLLRLLAHNYLDNLRDVLHLARVSQRTYQVLYKCRELEEARNDYRTFCASRHIVSDTCKMCVGDATGRFCFDCQGLSHRHCTHCAPPELFSGGFENWLNENKYVISTAQCHALQRASNALYNVGSPRLALHYWTEAGIPDIVRPGCRVNRLAQNGCVHAIDRKKLRPFRLFAYNAQNIIYSAISRSSRYKEEDQRDRRAVLLACLSYCSGQGKIDVQQLIKEAMAYAMEQWTCDKKMFRLVLEFAPALLSDPSVVAELIARTMPMILGGGSWQIRQRRVKDTCYLIQHAPVPNREAVFASALEGLPLRISRHCDYGVAIKTIGILMEIFALIDNDNKKAANTAPFDWTRVFETPEFYQLTAHLVFMFAFDQEGTAVCAEFLEWLETPRATRELPLLTASVKQWVIKSKLTLHDFATLVQYMAYIAGAFLKPALLAQQGDVLVAEPDQKRLKK